MLVESTGDWAEMADFAAFRLAGLDVAVCSGPQAGGGDGDECPLVRGEACPLADNADAVLIDLDLGRRPSRQVVVALATHHPRTPLVVEVDNHPAGHRLPTGAIPLRATSSVAGQIRVLRRAALEGRRSQSR